jgi:deoxyribodipyrimidine photo-lyase
MKSLSLLWFRRDLRLDDNPALRAALRAGAVVPVYVHAPDEEAPWVPGAASHAWLRASLRALDDELRGLGSRLVLRRGPTLAALQGLLADTGATAVHWNRLYEPAARARDDRVAQWLQGQGIGAHAHNAAMWVEPWEIATKAGEPYRVFTPYWRTLRARLDTLPGADDRPSRLPATPLPSGDVLDVLVPAPSPRWDRPMLTGWQPGEQGARDALDEFVESALRDYPAGRDVPDPAGTSRLSPHLHFGEISPRRIRARLHETRADAEPFLRQLGWREFSIHLLHHFPDSATHNLNPRFERFAWNTDEALLEARRRGRTGVPLVDAGMRELWATGWMHNRVRMVAASFLTKHLRQHWLHGARWFWDTLVDADLANNSMGWQWVAGTGADAAPYFRVFNPLSQAERFDADGRYRKRWLPAGYRADPIVDLQAGREAALAAYAASR